MLQIHVKNTYKPPFEEVCSFVEFEKWHVVRASVGSAGDVLACVVCMMVVGWRTSVGDMLLLLLLLLLKCCSEEKTIKYLLLKQKCKNVPNRFEQ